MLHIPSALTGEALARVTSIIARAQWIDGVQTAGHLSASVKQNQQIGEDDPLGREAAAIILEALRVNPLFVSAALPAKISPPLFNRYENSGAYGRHIDGSIRPLGAGRMRTDLSATLFLSSPGDYDGGALEVADSGGANMIKLDAGDMILYPSGAIHQVHPVTKGTRLASFFWVQSLVRDAAQRALLFDLDTNIQSLPSSDEWHEHRLALTALYHNLLRMWADMGG
jgi:PKHD-type hydroxylase